jgi:predicted  nucleic acid-binding Zn-ribbon protein
MPNLFTEYLKTNSKLKELQNQVNFFDNISDFSNNWKSKQFSILSILVSNKSRWALIVVNNSDQVYPFFYNSLNWGGNDATHGQERDEVAGQLKPILGNCDNTWITGTSYNNYTPSEASNNPDTESNQAYILSSFEKILDLIKSNPTAFKIKSGWNNNDFGNSIQPNAQDIAISKVKNRLGQDLNKWTSTFPKLTPEQVKTIYDQPKETHTGTDLKPKDLPDNWAEQLKSLKSWTDTFGNQKPDEIKKAIDILNQRPNISQADYDKVKGQLEQAKTDNKTGDDNYKTLETKNKDDLKTIENLKEQLKTAQEAQKKAEGERDTAKGDLTTANNTITSLNTTIADRDHTIKDKDKAIDANKDLPNTITSLNKQLADKDTELGKRTETINTLNTQLQQHDNQSTQYLNKLLAIYKQQITEATQTFYLNDLGLDESDDIRPKYSGADYLTLLDNLNGNADPNNVVNAFKIVVLICAIEKVKKVSDKWINNPAFKKLAFKLNKLKGFKDVKKFWDLNKDITISKENNPLYLPIIEQKNDYITKLDNIIKLWQN